MSTIPIVYMWGYADGFELVFSQLNSRQWAASVPPDLSDGQYAVEIHALAENGYICLWTGILYMNQGKHCLRLNKEKYYFRLKPQAFLIAHEPKKHRIIGKHSKIILRPDTNRYFIRCRRCIKV